MKNFQQNLLIALALGLCGLCAWQWYGQTRQRAEFNRLGNDLNQKSAAIRDYTNSITALNLQIERLDSRLSATREAAKATEQTVASQKLELGRLEATNEGLTNAIADYKKAVDSLQAKLKEAYEGAIKQNETMKELLAQRDEYVKKYNDSVKERNDVVAKYNDLVKQIEQKSAK